MVGHDKLRLHESGGTTTLCITLGSSGGVGKSGRAGPGFDSIDWRAAFESQLISSG